MDRFVGPARLEWWANRSTCFGVYGIEIDVAVDGGGQWRAVGRHVDALDAGRREGWEFLMAMDPHFSLAFPGEERGGIVVRVVEAGNGSLTFTEAPDWDGSVNVAFDVS
ncbi:hypothetical protein ACIBCA_11145 [Kitasatospora sp. NPDC051170]|uniref:hypothetical protein n=1 Tax=Kitasatospora sp. NPDC051170 TaxID=3364056 RepID=UPI0037A962FC